MIGSVLVIAYIARTYAKDCGEMVKKILEFDHDNLTGRELQEELYVRFGIELSKPD